MPSMTLGRVRPVFQGEYSSVKSYVVLDRVTYNGEVWECVKDAPSGTAPQDNSSTFWVKIGAKGPQGPQGQQGIQGPAGADGKQGPAGEKGDTGPQGDPGPKGDPGIQGPEGPQGPQGEQGAKGDPGPKGDTGAAGPAGADGAQGLPPEHEWQGTQLRFKEPDGSWGQFIDLRGAQGESATVPVATSAVAGKVKPQTGPTGGFVLGSDGTLTLQTASGTNLGGVKVSATAAAGTVPTVDGNGVLDASWLKKAMDAAAEAKEAADAAGGNNVKSYVIEQKESEDGTAAYRKWSDGYIEVRMYLPQGKDLQTVNFPVEFTKVPYCVGSVVDPTVQRPGFCSFGKVTPTTFVPRIRSYDNGANVEGAHIYACGY